MTNPDETLVLELLDAAARIERQLDRALSFTLGLSFTEYHLLARLARLHGGTSTRVELAEAVGLTPSAVTRALKPLEKIGLVVTQRGQRDARQNLASLTAAGQGYLENGAGVVRDVITDLPLEVLDRKSLDDFFGRLARR